MSLPIEISQEADQDLEDIFDYTLAAYGLEHAVKYVSSFDDIFDALSNNPALDRERSEVRPGLRSLIKEHLIIFYLPVDDRIRIVCIIVQKLMKC